MGFSLNTLWHCLLAATSNLSVTFFNVVTFDHNKLWRGYQGDQILPVSWLFKCCVFGAQQTVLTSGCELWRSLAAIINIIKTNQDNRVHLFQFGFSNGLWSYHNNYVSLILQIASIWLLKCSSDSWTNWNNLHDVFYLFVFYYINNNWFTLTVFYWVNVFYYSQNNFQYRYVSINF